MIEYFTIYGERCSGTNFLMNAILKNFNIAYTSKYSWKHFFGHYNFENNEEEDKTLFICIIRHPITWIDSFYKKLHHIPEQNKENIYTFLFNEFYSINDNNVEILEDRNIFTKNRYKNIFELRKIKNYYLQNILKKKVKNYILIRYEDLRDNYDSVLNFIFNKFNLIKSEECINNNEYIRIENYKGFQNTLFKKKNVLLSKNIISLIIQNIDKEQEKNFGYNI